MRRNGWARLIAVALLALAGGLAVGGTVTAAPPLDATAPFPARIVAGTCVQPPSSAAVTLAHVGYVAGGTGTPAAAGSLAATPAATSVTTVQIGLDALLASPHAIVIAAGAAHPATAIACGDVGGVRNGSDLVFGLAERHGSGFVGFAWLHARSGTTTTVSLFLAHGLGEGAMPPATMPRPAGRPAAVASPNATAAGSSAIVSVTDRVTIRLTDHGFVPSTIQATNGHSLTITLVNTGTRRHNFSVAAYGIDVTLAPGQRTTVTIASPNLGEYHYTSRAPGDAGMSGTLIFYI